MATLENISKKVVEKTAAMKVARKTWEAACKSRASAETQDILWNHYVSLQRIVHHIDNILKKASAATLELQRAAEWRAVDIYTEGFMETLKLTHPCSSSSQLKIAYDDLVTKANNAYWTAQDKLAAVLAQADPYLV
jgi:hypothetical protein